MDLNCVAREKGQNDHWSVVLFHDPTDVFQ